ncbi:MAG: ATP synthase F1 subunit gamma, partial [Candidatus Saccharimonas sp.]
MPSQRQLKTRIRSVTNTRQITKAMQMVAASKMRRAQEATKASHAYAEAANEILVHLASQGETRDHKWFATREVKRRLIIVISTDKGLAGAYDANVLKVYLGLLRSDDEANIKSSTITIGRKASRFATKLKDSDIVGSYDDLPDYPDGSQFYAVINTAKDMFERKEIDAVDVVYTRFISSMSQVADTVRLFPAGFHETEVSETVRAATFEPSPEEVLDSVAYRLISSKLFQALLDARA